jgi:hypothetical protein
MGTSDATRDGVRFFLPALAAERYEELYGSLIAHRSAAA